MRRFYSGLLVLTLLTVLTISVAQGESKTITLRYAHMNAATSVAGIQADIFAKLVSDYTKGQVKIQVYPASQLGNLQEVAEGVSTGSIALCHNTMAAIGSLYEDFGALDTPYLYRDVKHLLKVADPSSPIMKQLNEGLIKARNARVLYTFYFGTRELTANKAIYTPDDLKGVKVRSVPFPVYTAALEGMGATAVPLDWADTPTALSSKVVDGQENPIDTIFSSKLYDVQSHLMLTDHIMGAEVVVLNEKVWDSFSPDIQKAVQKAAKEASQKGTELTLQKESDELAQLKAKGMTVIGPKEGLKLDLFKKRVTDEINKRFGSKYGKLYQQIRAIK